MWEEISGNGEGGREAELQRMSFEWPHRSNEATRKCAGPTGRPRVDQACVCGTRDR